MIGSSKAIGCALTERLALAYPDAAIHAFSRYHKHQFEVNIFCHSIDDYHAEDSVRSAASYATYKESLDMIIVATGVLHEVKCILEKSIRKLSAEKFKRLFEANTILPVLIAKHFIPKLNREHSSIFAVLSARVGSISDNRLGGWYSYRASKAALNMIIKNLAIEVQRKNKKAAILGLHPGTVNSALSELFQHNVPQGKLFTPDYAVGKLLEVLQPITLQQSGKIFAWDSKEISP